MCNKPEEGNIVSVGRVTYLLHTINSYDFDIVHGAKIGLFEADS